jgi:cytochrome c oxidase subunit I+III
VATTLDQRLTRIWETPHDLVGQLTTVDHKIIGRRYIVTAFVFLVAGGLEALVMRWQLALPNQHVVSADAYNKLFSMHGITMIFWYAAPILSGFSNFLWPLILGSRDMAFPRINAFSYWVFLFSGLFLYSSVLIGQEPNAGWVSYTPLAGPTYDAGLNMQFYALGLILLAVSTTGGAINFIVTALRLRAPGMTVARIPVIIWSTLTVSVAVLFSLPALTVDCVFLYFEHQLGMHFFDPSGGGNPLLWEHLFWMFGHPWVYIVVLPAMGMASMMIPTFSRRPLAGHTLVVASTIATGTIGFSVWLHHMFSSGAPMGALTFFSAASMLISVPSAVTVVAWVTTLWLGKPVIRTPMLFMLGFVVLFVIGGVSGVMTAAAPFDWQLTDTYFIVAHLHYVLLGINVFPVAGAMYYWLPKITGRLLNERLGTLSFWTMFVGFNVGFFPMHIAGLLGMPRRIYTYPAGTGWDAVNLVSTIGAALFALGVLLFLIDALSSLWIGPLAGDNPWDAGTLEWSVASPPPAYNFAVIPMVTSREPLWEKRLTIGVAEGIVPGPVLEEGRETVATSALEADTTGVLHMPEDTAVPLLTSLGVLGAGYALLAGSVLWVGLAAAWLFVCITVWLWPSEAELAA